MLIAKSQWASGKLFPPFFEVGGGGFVNSFGSKINSTTLHSTLKCSAKRFVLVTLEVGLGWVGVNYGYWIIDPHLGTFLWPPTSVYALWLHIRKSYSREKNPSTVSCVQASSHRLERPLQYFYQGCPGWSTPDYNIQVGTVFTLIHKNLGNVPKKRAESARKVPKTGKVPEKVPKKRGK